MDEYEDFEDTELEYDDEDNGWSINDICYECMSYGDHYFINEDGESECACNTCPFDEWGRDD